MQAASDTNAVSHTWRHEVERLYEELLPRGRALDTFVKEQAAFYGVEEKRIRRQCTLVQVALDVERRAARMSTFQNVLEMENTNDMLAARVLRGCLLAAKRTPLLDKEGKPVLNAKGKPVYSSQPDYASRNKALDTWAKMRGAYAPRQVEIEAHVEHTYADLSDDQIDGILADCAAWRGKTINVTADGPAPEPEDSGDGRNTGGPSQHRPVLLAHEPDKDR